MGYAGGEDWMTGHMYIFHNTLFRSDEWLPTGGLGGNRIVKHTVSRNNILHVRSPRNYSASENEQNIDNDFDYDLYNGRVPEARKRTACAANPSMPPAPASIRRPRPAVSNWRPTVPAPAAGQPIPNFSGDLHRPGARHRRPPAGRAADSVRRPCQTAVTGVQTDETSRRGSAVTNRVPRFGTGRGDNTAPTDHRSKPC